MKLKKFAAAAAAAIMLAGCGNTSVADDLISKSESSSKSAEDLAADYWAEGSKETTPVPETVDLDSVDKSGSGVDIDLTTMDSNMVYAQVSNMLNEPDKYVGQTVKAVGTFAYTDDPTTGNEYFAVFIKDASACCQQGMEFVLAGEHKYPDDYPEINADITVIGTFNTYMEGKWEYCQLKDATMQVM